jgi:hypothetical protein
MGSITDIVTAWMSEEPHDEKWYKDRLEICASCPLNSLNKKDKTFLEKTREAIGGVLKDAYCTACGCTITKKAILKHSVCGMVELNPPQQPKWGALEAPTMSSNNNVRLSYVDGEKYSLVFGDPVIVDLGQREENVVEFKLEVKYNKKLRFEKITVGCGCTATNVELLPGNKLLVTIKISTVNFRVDEINKKSVFLYFLDTKTNFEQTHQIKCQLEKKTPITNT